MNHLDEVEKLVEVVAASRVYELTAQVGDRRITITGAARRQSKARPASKSAAAPPEESGSHDNAGAATSQMITAPMVGIFHHTEPAVTPGMLVKKDQVIGVIESMKLMNDIRCEEAGAVIAVSIEDGHAVEFGQPLFEIKPQLESPESQNA